LSNFRISYKILLLFKDLVVDLNEYFLYLEKIKPYYK
jgi:succinate dehydrogenase/fumarate reductase-like Fe-S protein